MVLEKVLYSKEKNAAGFKDINEFQESLRRVLFETIKKRKNDDKKVSIMLYI